MRKTTKADFPPARPGEVLREDFLKPMGMSQYALAKALGIPRIRVSEIVRGRRAVTPDTALRLARYFGTSAEFWVGARPPRGEDRRPRPPTRRGQGTPRASQSGMSVLILYSPDR